MKIEEQVAILMQGTEYGDPNLHKNMERELKERLIEAEKSGRPLRVYCGYDPRTADLHIGHTVTMRKLRQFQDLGHEVVFLIGTYTSLIGDPSDKDKLRPLLTQEQTMENAASYAEQAFRILDREKTIVRYNHEWLQDLTFADLIQLGSNFTIQQFLTRDAFRKRWDSDDPVYLHEFFYAIMQGYDAYALHTDVQVGGTDQLFNILTAGRKVMASMDEKPNIGIIMAILPGTDGVVKMSKSLGNHIPLNSTPEDMYGKVMSIPDKAMAQYAKLVTRWYPPQIVEFEHALKNGSIHPRDAKMKLAFEVTSTYYSEEQAKIAENAFVALFQQGFIPTELEEFKVSEGQTVLDIMVAANLVASRSDGRRMIEQNGVKFEGSVVSKPETILPKSGVLQVGKRKFIKCLI